MGCLLWNKKWIVSADAGSSFPLLLGSKILKRGFNFIPPSLCMVSLTCRLFLATQWMGASPAVHVLVLFPFSVQCIVNIPSPYHLLMPPALQYYGNIKVKIIIHINILKPIEKLATRLLSFIRARATFYIAACIIIWKQRYTYVL